ncbi:response regulator [Roseococcus pinisoli]|uniref:histidine kinase n=1 Tax=Roseococcus pinisoli TaxID=2835040 RepID=A0ABS5QKB3_9PROT|nr:response regulator [Roseococcus pinisoli]MBS7813003.1 response regulator [Roseococcus pinisoli]
MPPDDVKFLLVDDLEENLFALEALLRRDGLQLFRAKSGPEALELLLRHDFALALLDVQMEGMDGFELAELMRGTGRTRRVPIIFLTAVATDERRHFRGYETGAVDFLFKPIDTHMLTSKAGVFFDLARQRQELARQRDDIRFGAVKLEEALTQFRAHADNSPLALVEFDAAFRITDWSLGAARIFGWSRSEAMGRSVRELGWLQPEDMPALKALEAELQAGEAPRAVGEIPLRRKDGMGVDCEWYCSALRVPDGALVSISAQILDITERRRAERTQRLLIGELNHRVKNMLGTVQAIAAQGLHRAADPADFVTDFSGRIQALARAHSLLSDSTWRGAMLKELIEGQLRLGTIDADRLTVSGRDLQLAPQIALHMALILHELTTNANKHGALSKPMGRLTMEWSVLEDVLHFRWKEWGTGPVAPPSRTGFGTKLIEQSVGTEGGSARAHYGPDGMDWEIAVPLQVEGWSLEAGAPAAARGEAARPPRRSDPSEENLGGMRLLLIEDEPIISMQMAAVLEQAGAVIAGTAGTIEQALKTIENLSLDGALLDGNLRGLPVEEVASALTARGVPFVFVSGYGREHLPRDFEHVAIVPKPFSGTDLVAAVSRFLPAELPR